MRTATLYIIVGEPDLDAPEECPACGFDAMIGFPLTGLSLNGVGPVGTYRACLRCAEES